MTGDTGISQTQKDLDTKLKKQEATKLAQQKQLQQTALQRIIRGQQIPGFAGKAAPSLLTPKNTTLG